MVNKWLDNVQFNSLFYGQFVDEKILWCIYIKHLGLCLHVRSKSPFFLPFKNGFNVVLWCFLNVNTKKTKGAADKNSDVNGTWKQTSADSCLLV